MGLTLYFVAPAILTAGTWALFAQNLFPLDLLNFPPGDVPVAQSFVWLLTGLSNVLLVPGLASVAALLVLPPFSPRTVWAPQPAFDADTASALRGAPSARAAWMAGGALIAVGAVNLFASRLFPLSMRGQTITDGQSSMELQPWPFLLAGSAPAFLLTGFGAVAWGAFIWALVGVRTAAVARTQEDDGVAD